MGTSKGFFGLFPILVICCCPALTSSLNSNSIRKSVQSFHQREKEPPLALIQTTSSYQVNSALFFSHDNLPEIMYPSVNISWALPMLCPSHSLHWKIQSSAWYTIIFCCLWWRKQSSVKLKESPTVTQLVNDGVVTEFHVPAFKHYVESRAVSAQSSEGALLHSVCSKFLFVWFLRRQDRGGKSYTLNVCAPKSLCWRLTPNEMVLGGEDVQISRFIWSHEDGALGWD